MKRKITMVIIGVICCFLLFGCNKKDPQDAKISAMSDSFECGDTSNHIEPDEAIKIAQKDINKVEKPTITNFDNPTIQEIIFDEKAYIYLYNNDENFVGRTAYMITFHTELDPLLGPITVYVDKENGELIGADLRE